MSKKQSEQEFFVIEYCCDTTPETWDDSYPVGDGPTVYMAKDKETALKLHLQDFERSDDNWKDIDKKHFVVVPVSAGSFFSCKKKAAFDTTEFLGIIPQK